MHRSTPLFSSKCFIGQTANTFPPLVSTSKTAVSSPLSTTCNVPCQTLSRQSAPRQPPAWGLGGNLKICALGILRRVRWIIVSSVGVKAVESKGRSSAGWLCWVD